MLSSFPGVGRLLYQLEPRSCFVLADKPPTTAGWEKTVIPLEKNRIYHFRLCANPTKKTGTTLKSERENGLKRNGRRVPLGEGEALSWLRRKLTEAGAEVVECRVKRRYEKTGYRQGKRISFLSMDFVGRLWIRDLSTFQEAPRKGFGPAKAYGHGLLLLRPTDEYVPGVRCSPGGQSGA